MKVHWHISGGSEWSKNTDTHSKWTLLDVSIYEHGNEEMRVTEFWFSLIGFTIIFIRVAEVLETKP